MKIVLEDGEIDFGKVPSETAMYNFIMRSKYIIFLAEDGASKVIALETNEDGELIEAVQI